MRYGILGARIYLERCRFRMHRRVTQTYSLGPFCHACYVSMLEGDVIMTPSSPTPRPDGISHEIKQTAAITYRTLSQGTGEELGMNTY